MSEIHAPFMRLALEQARLAGASGEVPIGAVVVADIGGTHARFALAQDGALSEVRVYAAVELTSDVAAVARYLDDVKPDAAGAVIAVAGPVIDGVGRLTNLPLEFSAREIARRTRLARVLVINDFAAVSAAVPFLAAGDLCRSWLVQPE